ncbi:MAG: gamma-glutamyltransferase, partial [Congregibacter sp.]|nr:gamma-glutamyltransferase [Congregibacter sp.]
MIKRSLLALSLSCAFTGWAQAQSPHPFGIPQSANDKPSASITAMPGSRAQGWLSQGRSELLARHGVVASSDPLASEAGLEILRAGGNAIDAIVAAAAVLDVTSQNDTGIGGDLFALIWSAKDKKLYGLNSAGWSPEAWTLEYFTQTLGLQEMPDFGVNAATVPGAISGYAAMLDRFGTMGFEETFARAAKLADEGWGQAERRHSDLVEVQDRLRQDADSAATFLLDGEVPPLYSVIKNPGLASALRLIQREGRDAFYTGAIADAIVKKVQASGGVMTHADLAEYQSEWIEPVTTNYHGYDIYQLPPPGQGFAALEMLNILEVCAPVHGVDLAALGPSNPDYWHMMVEA